MNNKRRQKKPSAFTALLTVPCLCIFGVVVVFVIILAASGELTHDLDIKGDTSVSESSTAPEQNISLSLNSGTLAYTRPDIKMTVDDSSIPVPETVKELLGDYFTDIYTVLGSLEFFPVSGYFNTEERLGELSAGLCDTALEYNVYLRRSFNSNLSFVSADVTVTVTDFKINGNTYEISFLLNDSVEFALSSKPSYSVGCQGKAVIQSDSGKLLSMYDETAAVMQTEEFMLDRLELDGNTQLLEADIPEDTDLAKTYALVLKQLKTSVDSEAEKRSAQFKAVDAEAELPTADNEYDRDAAVEYSYLWTDEQTVVRNTEEYSDYSDYGGNCQNFVSQCLHAGGLPMDWQGTYDDQWKWFDDELNYKETKKGRVPSWSETYSFYMYCLNNSDPIVTLPDANLFTGEPGDVIQYSVNGYTYHSVIITDVIRDSAGNVIDYLVNSNTADKVDFPMSAYGYSEIRLIKIIGYNGTEETQ